MKYSLKNINKLVKEDREMIFFYGHSTDKDVVGKECLSQFYPTRFMSDHVNLYFTAEQYMMYMKAITFGDMNTAAAIMQTNDPGRAKALGRLVKNFDQKIWDITKTNIVKNGNFYKFSQNLELREYLLSTKDSILVESAPHDKIWGIGKGLSSIDEDLTNPENWDGQNLLGFCLMEIRDVIRRFL